MRGYTSTSQALLTAQTPVAERVAAVIVTYKRPEMFSRTLESCLSQSDALHVVVVDNTPAGEGDYVKERIDHMNMAKDRITCLRPGKNLGGAGGFALGMQSAYERGFVWLWVMDDDVVPLPGALAALLAHGSAARCVYPAKLCADGRLFAFEGRISRRTLWRTRVHTMQSSWGEIEVNSGNFEGAFIHREVIDKIGLPEAGFFLTWDDTLFGMRAAEYFRCIYITTICMQKQLDKERLKLCGKAMLSSTIFTRYYFFRNYCFVMSYLDKSGDLCPLAYVLYGILLTKALLITAIVDRSCSGIVKVMKGSWYGLLGRQIAYEDA
ncbi:MAG: glycosyltransferase [Desulfovibrio sp.]|jgi:GT2 family glycosyltransferase|nr:glycosyltransferase [Desulfovibrio sp.]